MRRLRYLTAAAAITGVLTGSAVTAATSQGAETHAAASVGLHGGTTAVTTAPGIAAALIKHGIVPRATWPGGERVLVGKSGLAVRFTFPRGRRLGDPEPAGRQHLSPWRDPVPQREQRKEDRGQSVPST